MIAEPIANGGNGVRDVQGRFVAGNPGGPGNPYTKRVAQIRSLIADAVTEEDLRAVIGALVAKAREGDINATRELLDRLAGKPAAAIDPDQLRLEEQRLALQDRRVDVQEDRSWM